MTIITVRQPKGTPTGGQFAATFHPEPDVTLSPVIAALELEMDASEHLVSELDAGVNEQGTETSEAPAPGRDLSVVREGLARHRTPLTDAMAARGLDPAAPLPGNVAASSTDESIRAIQARLAGKRRPWARRKIR